MTYQRLLALATYAYSAFLFVVLWYVIVYTDYIWYFFGSAIGLFVLVWVAIVGIKKQHLEYLVLGVSPLLMIMSGFAFYILADSDLLRLVQSILLVGGVFFMLRALYYYFWRSVKYQPNSLQIQLKYVHIVTIFFTATFLYAIEIFLNIPLWYTALGQAAVLVLFFLQQVYTQRLLKQERIAALVGAFLLTQVFVSIAFLPFLVYVKGIIFMLVYYVVVELYEAALRGFWQKKNVFSLLTIFVVFVAVLLITTPWY